MNDINRMKLKKGDKIKSTLKEKKYSRHNQKEGDI